MTEPRPELSELATFLMSPSQQVGLFDLPSVFAHAIIRLTVSGAARMADDPAAPGKLRGALGTVLKQSASAESVSGSACPWDPPCALDLLFRAQGKMTAGMEFPKPFVLALDAVGPDLEIRCTLFGLAADWSGQIGDALVAGIRSGLRHPNGGTPDVSDRRIAYLEGVPGARPDGMPELSVLDLEFITPFVLRSGRQTHAALPALVTGIGNRVSGLARWMGIEVIAEWRGLKTIAEELSVVQSTVASENWLRGSRRQGALIGMQGFSGVARIQGQLGPLLPLLTLGQVTHAGAHAALGMGRYRIHWV